MKAVCTLTQVTSSVLWMEESKFGSTSLEMGVADVSDRGRLTRWRNCWHNGRENSVLRLLCDDGCVLNMGSHYQEQAKREQQTTEVRAKKEPAKT